MFASSVADNGPPGSLARTAVGRCFPKLEDGRDGISRNMQLIDMYQPDRPICFVWGTDIQDGGGRRCADAKFV